MGTVEQLVQRECDRDDWLRRAVGLLESDRAVVAAWLWGSAGRGEADALSDLDLFVAVDDRSALDAVEDGFGRFGEVQWCREVPYNAPPAGRYFTVGYPAAAEPLPIDWYWQLADVAAIASDTLVLFEKSPLRSAASRSRPSRPSPR